MQYILVKLFFYLSEVIVICSFVQITKLVNFTLYVHSV